MLFIHCIVAADTDKHLSRLDPSLLSNQARMEIFLDGIQRKHLFQDENGNFTDFEEWDIVEMDQSNQKIIAIQGERRWNEEDRMLGGSVLFAFLPDTVHTINLAYNTLSGEIEFRDLPPNLDELFLTENLFEGKLVTAHIPRSVTKFSVRHNKLQGTIDCAKFPPKITHIDISRNNFEGSLHVKHLLLTIEDFSASDTGFSGKLEMNSLGLPSLEILRLGNNLFTGGLEMLDPPPSLKVLDFLTECKERLNGTVHIPVFPLNLEEINFEGCALTGTFPFEALPANLTVLNLDTCPFCGSLGTSLLPQALTTLSLNDCNFSEDFAFDELPEGLGDIDISENNFSGTISTETLPVTLTEVDIHFNLFYGDFDFTRLPPGLERLFIGRNRFCGSMDLSQLPETLCHISAESNNFSGWIDLENASHLDEIDISFNQIDEVLNTPPGTLVIDEQMSM